MSLKKIYSFIFIASISLNLSAQDYILNPTNLNVQGNPGDFMLSTLIVNNTSANTITMHFERIVKNIPVNWSSCFCYPACLAPSIDTLTFSIAPFSSDSIKPNYNTDLSTPGIGYVTITLYQQGFPSSIDTIAFSGSTLSASGINETAFSPNFTAYPNPFNTSLTIHNKSPESYTLSVFNSSNEIVYFKKSTSSLTEKHSLGFLPDGIYVIKSEFVSGKMVSNKIIKSKNSQP